VQGIELPPLICTTQLENQGCLRAPHRPMTNASVCWRLRRRPCHAGKNHPCD
jgi:hypothetical protein